MVLTPEKAAALAIERMAAKTKILSYIEYMRPEGLPDFHHQPALHHRKVFAPTLDRLNLAIHTRSEQNDRAACSVPPGAAKSFYYSIVWPTQLLAANPSWKIICASAAESLAEDFARRRRQIMLTPRWERLAETTLSPDARGLAFQGTPEGGGIYAYGAGSIIQGIRADATVGDDLVGGHEEAGNIALLDKKWNWYLSELRERLRPGGVEALVATRWALLDPIGRILRLTAENKEKWHYDRIPHICDSEDDPLGRKIGERLWPEYFSERKMRDAMRNPLYWNTLHQQNPAVSEYSWVPLDAIQLIDREELPAHLSYYIGIDIALGVGTGDFTVFAVIGVDENKNFYLVDLYRKQGDPNETARTFISMCEQYSPRFAWIDNDNASKMWAKIVEMEAANVGVRVPLRMSKMRNHDKEVRAAPLRNLFVSRRWYIVRDAWTQVVIKEVAEFPDGQANDDTIDAMGLPPKELKYVTGPVIVAPVDKKPIIGSFQQKGGKIMTTQPLKDMQPLNAGRNLRGRI